MTLTWVAAASSRIEGKALPCGQSPARIFNLICSIICRYIGLLSVCERNKPSVTPIPYCAYMYTQHIHCYHGVNTILGFEQFFICVRALTNIRSNKPGQLPAKAIFSAFLQSFCLSL